MSTPSALRICVLLAAIAVGAASKPPRTATWKTFRSETYHYAVRYPGSWYPFTTELRQTMDYLDILSFPPSETVTGVVIKRGGAEISVGRAPRDVLTLEQWIKRGTKFNTEVHQEEVTGFAKKAAGCRALTKVTSLSEVGPATYQLVTEYYCTTARGLYGIELTSWKGDPKQKEFQRVALKIALSLRSW